MNCPYCGYFAHERIEYCPSIKAIEYYPDGTIKRVEKRDLFPPVYAPVEAPIWKSTRGGTWRKP